MRVVYVPIKGNVWFWDLAAESLDHVRYRITKLWPETKGEFFDGILGLLCDEGSLLPIIPLDGPVTAVELPQPGDQL